MMDNTWEIMNIISHYNGRARGLDTWSKEYEEVKKLYAQAIRLQCAGEYGLVMTTDDFIETVENGYFNDCDGSGRFADFDGTKHEYIRCNPNWLKKNRGTFPFVFWYNK